MSDFQDKHSSQDLQGGGRSTEEAGLSSLETRLQFGSAISIPKGGHSLNTYCEVHT